VDKNFPKSDQWLSYRRKGLFNEKILFIFPVYFERVVQASWIVISKYLTLSEHYSHKCTLCLTITNWIFVLTDIYVFLKYEKNEIEVHILGIFSHKLSVIVAVIILNWMQFSLKLIHKSWVSILHKCLHECSIIHTIHKNTNGFGANGLQQSTNTCQSLIDYYQK
jgi:hypothetical protein